MKEQRSKYTDSDLNKSIPELLDDFNIAAKEASLGLQTWLALDVARCFVTMMAKVGMEHSKLSRRMFWLTIIIIVFTAFLVFKEVRELLFDTKPQSYQTTKEGKQN